MLLNNGQVNGKPQFPGPVNAPRKVKFLQACVI